MYLVIFGGNKLKKETMIQIGIISTFVIFGLLINSKVYGLVTPEEELQLSKRFVMMESMLNYCIDHASDSANPIQDLLDKGLASSEFIGVSCADVKLWYDNVMATLSKEEYDLLHQR